MQNENTLTPGDHIKVRRKWYSHHGVYIGGGEVVHYSGEVKDQQHARVSVVSLPEFIQDGAVRVVAHRGKLFTPEEVVTRAKSRLGENSYNLVFENCEHFATWCVTDKKVSKQVNRTVKGALASAGVVLLVAGRALAKLARRGSA